MKKRRWERAAIDRAAHRRVFRIFVVPAERGARHESTELVVVLGELERSAFARDGRLRARAPCREELDQTRIRHRPDLGAVVHAHAINLWRHIARGFLRRSRPFRIGTNRVRIDIEHGRDVTRALGGVVRRLRNISVTREAELLDVCRGSRRTDVQPSPANELLERLHECRRGLKSLRRIFCESAKQNGAHVVGHATRVAIDRRHVGVANAKEHVELAPTGKKRAHRDHLGEHDAEREEIASCVELASDDLLGRHVPELSFELTDVRAAFELRGARDPEIRELHGARSIDQNISRRDVAMHE